MNRHRTGPRRSGVLPGSALASQDQGDGLSALAIRLKREPQTRGLRVEEANPVARIIEPTLDKPADIAGSRDGSAGTLEHRQRRPACLLPLGSTA